MDSIDAAAAFLGGYDKDRGSMQNSTVQSETHTITGTATSDSADGLVMVDLEGYTISEDDEQSLELPTTVDVHEGDTVQVTLVGGVAKSPIVTGVVGGGDRLSGNVTEALDAAQAAELIVRALNYYFFHDDAGAHVTTEPNNPNVGPNALLDALALYFRDGLDVYAKFGRNGSQIGKDDEAHLVMDANSMELMDENGNRYFFAGDRRDLDTGTVTMTDTIALVEYTTQQFELVYPASSITSVAVDGVELVEGTDWYFIPGSLLPFAPNGEVVLNQYPPQPSIVTIIYDVTQQVTAYSFGGDASGMGAVAEGNSTASGKLSHAEGNYTGATSKYAHSEGNATYARDQEAHSEGYGTLAAGIASHAEGWQTTSAVLGSHAEGRESYAAGMYSHAEGFGTRTSADGSHAGGMFNVVDTNDTYAEIIGNGANGTSRSNARTLDWNGNEELQGTIYLGGCTANGETPYSGIRYNTSTSQLEYYNGTSWQSIQAGGGAAIGDCHIYAGTLTKTVSGKEATIWNEATFKSTFNTTRPQLCGVMISNGDSGTGDTLGATGAEYWTSGTYQGWHARWVNNLGSGGRRFNYIVAVPNQYSTV